MARLTRSGSLFVVARMPPSLTEADKEVQSMGISVIGSVVCPVCGAYELRSSGHRGAVCTGCGFVMGGPMLKTLLEIVGLPDVHGSHACEECGHPQMKLLPDGVFHCPACRAEVLPVGIPVGGKTRRQMIGGEDR